MNTSHARLQNLIGHRFTEPDLLELALTHPSWGAEHVEEVGRNNQRLEFLGDGLLQAALSELLFERYPEMTEGQLTKLRSVLADKACLILVGTRLGLWDHVRMSSGQRKDLGGKPKLLADAVEALIAAIHLDGGDARLFVETLVADEISKAVAVLEERNPKGKLQERLALHCRQTCVPFFPPKYEEKWRRGPDASNRWTFCCEVIVDSSSVAQGIGSTIREAEEAAACRAIVLLGF